MSTIRGELLELIGSDYLRVYPRRQPIQLHVERPALNIQINGDLLDLHRRIPNRRRCLHLHASDR